MRNVIAPLVAAVSVGAIAAGCVFRGLDIDIGLVPVAMQSCVAPPDGSMQHQLPDTLRQTLVANGYCHYFIPEYHDEQRLSDGAAGYGQVAYVFASPRVRQIADHSGFDAGWVNVAIIDVAPDKPPFTNNILPTYAALRLGLQQSCMYIRHRHSIMGARWEAAIGPPRMTSGVPLCNGGPVRRVPLTREQPTNDPAAYVGAARFIESSGRRPMIGVRCGNGFCVAGAASPNEIPAPAHAYLSVPNTPQWRIKPWFDDQVLGALGPGGYGIHPSIRASVVPDDSLGERKEADFRAGWVFVATVVLPERLDRPLPPKYGTAVDAAGNTTGFGLREGANRVEMRAITVDGTERWQARISKANHPGALIRVVHRHDHGTWVQQTGIPVPATARFRWLDSDETIWVACDAGCCRVEAY